MKAKTVKELLEAGLNSLEVSANHSMEDLLDLIKSADRMLKKGIEPLLNTKEEYKKARKKALSTLKKNHKLSQKEIDSKLNESINERFFLNEVFDVLTWSRSKLPKEVADDIEEAHEGGFGEKFQTSLLKIMNKDELLKWYNKNFEVGIVNEYNKFQRGINSKEALSLGSHRFQNIIDSNDLALLCEISGNIEKETLLDEKILKKYAIDQIYDKEEIKRILYLWDLYSDGTIEPDQYFDWKESAEMLEFIDNNQKGRYVYNGLPGADGWQIIFSDIEFPNAESMENLEDI